MNKRDSKRLGTIIGNLKKDDDQLNELLRKLKISVIDRSGEVDESEDSPEVVEADVECMLDAVGHLADAAKLLNSAKQILDEHFQLD